MKARDLVNSGLLSVHPRECILDAIDLFVSHNLDMIPVKVEHIFLGVLRKIDIVLALESFSSKVLNSVQVKDCMISKLASCKEDESLEIILNKILSDPVGILVVKHGSTTIGTIGYSELLLGLRSFAYQIENPLVLTPFMDTKVKRIEGDAHLRKLRLYFKKNKSDYALVENSNGTIGIVTLKDLFGAVRKELDEERIHVSNIMSPNLVSLHPGSTLNDALTLVVNRKFNQIPLFSDGALEGIITLKTLLEGYVQLIAQIKKDEKLVHFRTYLS